MIKRTAPARILGTIHLPQSVTLAIVAGVYQEFEVKLTKGLTLRQNLHCLSAPCNIFHSRNHEIP